MQVLKRPQNGARVLLRFCGGAGIDKTTEWYRCVFVEVGHSAGIDKTAECYRCVLVSLWG